MEGRSSTMICVIVILSFLVQDSISEMFEHENQSKLNNFDMKKSFNVSQMSTMQGQTLGQEKHRQLRRAILESNQVSPTIDGRKHDYELGRTATISPPTGYSEAPRPSRSNMPKGLKYFVIGCVIVGGICGVLILASIAVITCKHFYVRARNSAKVSPGDVQLV